MIRDKFKLKPPSGKPMRKSMTVPSQALTVKQIVDKFLKGIPVDVSKKPVTYLDQDEEDFEALGRMDKADMAFHASEQRAKFERLKSEYEANERSKAEEKQRQESEEKARKASASGIDSLDNTMPHDTNLINNQLGSKKKS